MACGGLILLLFLPNGLWERLKSLDIEDSVGETLPPASFSSSLLLVDEATDGGAVGFNGDGTVGMYDVLLLEIGSRLSVVETLVVRCKESPLVRCITASNDGVCCSVELLSGPELDDGLPASRSIAYRSSELLFFNAASSAFLGSMLSDTVLTIDQIENILNDRSISHPIACISCVEISKQCRYGVKIESKYGRGQLGQTRQGRSKVVVVNLNGLDRLLLISG